MPSLSESAQRALCSLIQRLVGPAPNLEHDRRFDTYILTHTYEPRYIWLSPCGGVIVTIMLLFDEGNTDDGRYVALVRTKVFGSCILICSQDISNVFQCNCAKYTHRFFLTQALPVQTLAKIHAYRASLEKASGTLRHSGRIRERALRANISSSSHWGRLLPSEHEDGSVLHYESDTAYPDPESCSGGTSEPDSN